MPLLGMLVIEVETNDYCCLRLGYFKNNVLILDSALALETVEKGRQLSYS